MTEACLEYKHMNGSIDATKTSYEKYQGVKSGVKDVTIDETNR